MAEITAGEARQRLEEASAKQGVSLVFGAGLSYYSGLPLFADLYSVVVSAIVAGEPIYKSWERRLTAGLTVWVPETLFALLARVLGKKGLDPVRVFSLGRPTYAHFAVCQLAHELRCPVVTTNFDMLIERAALERGQTVDLVKVHGSVDRIESIKIAVDQVWKRNADQIARFVAGRLDHRVVFVAGYSGLDSDFFPLLKQAGQVIWLQRRPGPPADHLVVLASLDTVTGDIEDALSGLVKSDLQMPRSASPEVVAWEEQIKAWGSGLSLAERHAVLGRLLAHVGALDEAEGCYQHLLMQAVSQGDRAAQAVAHAGLVRVLGPAQGRIDDVLIHLDAYKRLAGCLPSRLVVPSSVALNAAEAAAVGGRPFKWGGYWTLLIPRSLPSRQEVTRYGWGLLQASRNRVRAGNYVTARLLLKLGKAIFDRYADYAGVQYAVRQYAELAKLSGRYARARGLLESVGGTDARFAGDIAGFWVQLELADIDRLQGCFDRALDRLSRFSPESLNPSQALWLHLTRAACLRGRGYSPEEVLLELARAKVRAQEPAFVSGRCRVAVETTLVALAFGRESAGTVDELDSCHRESRAAGLRVEGAYLELAEWLLLANTSKNGRTRSPLSAPTLWTAIIRQLVSWETGQERFRRGMLGLLLTNLARRRGMSRETAWLQSRRLPVLTELQFP